MRKRFATIIGAAFALMAIAGTPGASAATEVGSDCPAASPLMANYTLFQTAKDPGSPLPTAAPAARIVTGWRVDSDLPYPIVERLRTIRATGAPDEFQVLAESDSEVVQPGQNAFETRIPIDAGDLVGVHGRAPWGRPLRHGQPGRHDPGHGGRRARRLQPDLQQIHLDPGPSRRRDRARRRRRRIRGRDAGPVPPERRPPDSLSAGPPRSRRRCRGGLRSSCSSRPAPKRRSPSAAASATGRRKNAPKDAVGRAARGW